VEPDDHAGRVTTMRILVAYASKHGGTAEIADAIAARLRERGLDVDERPVLDATVDRHDAVVLGSAVFVGSWMKEATAFAKANAEALARIPVWAFSSGPTDDPGEHAVSEKQHTEIDALLHPREHRVFGGVLDPATLGFVERRVVKMVKAPIADRRDWDEIRAFGDEIADALAAMPAV
jgi:menaquinone-dependent protoporphyrinogen oxidase